MRPPTDAVLLVGNRADRPDCIPIVAQAQKEHPMSSRKFHSSAALCGDGLRPELKALFDRLSVDPESELFVRSDGLTQSRPDPLNEIKNQNRPLRKSK
jgi:hypothetical protein